MNKQGLNQMWNKMSSESREAKYCPICKQEKPTIKIKHPFKDEMTEVRPICKCEAEEDEKFWQKQKDDERKRKINKILKMSSELANIKEFTFDNYERRKGNEAVIDEVKKAVNNFDQKDRMGLFIFGVTGNGKSHATAAGGNELLEKGYSVIFLTEKDLLNRLKATNNFNNHETFDEVMSAAVNADLLIWDDFLSSTQLNGAEKDWIFQIINGRERAKKPIWFTSNLTLEQVKSPQMELVLDPKGRNWWRIMNSVELVYNSAINERQDRVMKRMKGLD